MTTNNETFTKYPDPEGDITINQGDLAQICRGNGEIVEKLKRNSLFVDALVCYEAKEHDNESFLLDTGITIETGMCSEALAASNGCKNVPTCLDYYETCINSEMSTIKTERGPLKDLRIEVAQFCNSMNKYLEDRGPAK